MKKKLMVMYVSGIIKHLIIAFFALLLAAGCTRSKQQGYEAPRFRREIQKDFSFVSDEVPFYGNHSGFLKYKDKLIIVREGTDDAFVFLYDLNDNIIENQCVLFGRAEHEMMYCTNCSLDIDNGNLFLYDGMTFKMLKVNLDDWIQGKQGFISKVDVSTMSSHAEEICKVPYGWLVLNGFPKKYQGTDTAPRIEIYDEKGVLIDSDDSELDVGEIERLTLYRGGLSLSSDGTTWSITSSTGGILETFRYVGGTINRIGLKYFYPSDFETHLNDWANSETVMGFHMPCISEDKVYAAFEFEETWKDSQGINKELKGRNYRKIGVFDINGNPIEVYNVNYQVQSIYVSGKTLYALVKDEDDINHFATLDL